MVAINHALTGAVIGLSVANPALALPLALASHFILDALPHFGARGLITNWITNKKFALMLVIDALLCFGLIVILFSYQPHHYVIASICAFLAASPDFLHINRFIKANKKLAWKPNLYSRFAANIQWFEKPIGGLVEIVWFIAVVRLVGIFI